jgi:hypothetical protein
MNNIPTKKELLSIISKMKKNELLEIVQNKYGGYNSIIKTPIHFKEKNNKNKNKNKNPDTSYIMKNNNAYNKIYVNNNNQ